MSDYRTYPEVASVISDISGRHAQSSSVSADEALKAGQWPEWVETQMWFNDIGERGDPKELALYGLKPTSFRDWAMSRAAQFKQNVA